LRFCYSAVLEAVVTWPGIPDSWKPEIPDPKLKQSDGAVIVEVKLEDEKGKDEKIELDKTEKEEKDDNAKKEKKEDV
jgi:hypothetical protein